MQRSRKRKLRRLEESRALGQGLPLASGLMVAMTGAQAQENVGVGEIIVTATKREERLQDVPLAIQAFGTETLQNLRVSDFNDYVQYLPNVSYQQLSPGFARIFMRGVSSGDNGNHSGPLPSVGVYLDEQPVTTIQGPLDIHVYDIARVETLAGPQGTLYGASSQAGTIRIITNKAELGESYSELDFEINDVKSGEPGYQFQGLTNIPIGDSAAARLVAWYRKDGGFVNNIAGTRSYPTLEADEPGSGTFTNADQVQKDFNDVETYGGRATLRLELGDNWTVTPGIMAQHQDTTGTFYYDPSVGDLKVIKYYDEGSTDDWYQAALTVEGRLSDWTLTYAGSYLDRDDETESDYSDYALAYDNLYFFDTGETTYGDYFFNDDGDLINPAEFIRGKDGYKKISQELRLTSPADNRWRFTAGLFYQKQQHDIEQRYIVNDLATSAEVTGWSDTWWLTQQEREDVDKAIFGEFTFDILDNLSVTAGARFFDSDNSLRGFFGFGYTNGWTSRTGEKSCFGFEYGRDPFPEDPIDPPPQPGGGVNGGPCINLDNKVSDSDHTEKLNLTWKVTADHMLYATYATGYRPGGVNRRNDPGYGPFEPDFLDSFEFGWKTTWADGTLRWNGAVFYQQWDNFQFSFLGANGLTNITNSQGGATIPGIETDMEWVPVDGLTVSAAMMWVDPELDGDFCETAFDDDGNTLPVADCDPAELAPDGTTLPTTPKFKGNVRARYEFGVGNGVDANVQGTLAYNGDARSALLEGDNQLLGGDQDAYTIVNLSAGLDNGEWSAEVFVDNVFDERAELYRFAQCDEGICAGNAGLGGVTYVVPSTPRMLGFRLGKKF
jgi:outer membrane receptor protein involved in Fe transport